MKILAPAASAYEAVKLIKMGADELYCGIHPSNWRTKYGKDIWMNRRGDRNASLHSTEELRKLVTAAHEHNVSVCLALNMPYYTDKQHVIITSILEQILSECTLDALIIGDPGLIIAIKDKFPDIVIHVSSLAPVLNSSSAAFYEELGASRIIFPRYIALPQLKATLKLMSKAIETEVFILNDGCFYEEGFCNVSHALGGAICHSPFQMHSLITAQNRKPVLPKQPFNQHLNDFRTYLWHIRNCNGGSDPKGYPLGMCGLCAIPELIDLGVTSLKIVGREAPLRKNC